MSKIIITEEQLRHIVKRQLTESIHVEKDRLYHQCLHVSLDDIKDIFKYGLRKNDNGEANGIWFCHGNLFYNQLDNAPLIFSLPYTEEIKEICGFYDYDFENNASTIVAHNDIPIDILTLEQCPLVRYKTKFGNGILTDNKNNFKLFEGTYKNLSEWDKTTEFVIFEDMYFKLYGIKINEKEKLLIQSKLPNFKFENLI